MKHTLYKTQGTCSQLIDVTVDEQDVIQEISFIGGCGGNLQAVCRLVKGQKADKVKWYTCWARVILRIMIL